MRKRIATPGIWVEPTSLAEIELAIRRLLGVLCYDPDDHPSLIAAACNDAAEKLIEWRKDWNKPPFAFGGLVKNWPGMIPASGSADL